MKKNTYPRSNGKAAVLIAFLFLTVMQFQGFAQLTMKVGAPDISEFPLVHISVLVQDRMTSVKDLQPSDFVVLENGAIRTPLLLDCQTKESLPPISILFLIDVSPSMTFYEGQQTPDPDSVKWLTAKNVLNQSFNKLRPQDDAALVSFWALSNLETDFTSDTMLLEDAVAGLQLQSGTAIFDALWHAAELCAMHITSTNKKAIILLTDGNDNSSLFTREQAIARLRSDRYPVYSIGLGLVPDSLQPWRNDMDTLRRISAGTNGLAYYAPTSAQLDSIFSAIFESIYTSECILTYTSGDTCRHGDTRNVDIACTVNGSTVAGNAWYTLPDFHSRASFSLDIPADVQHSQQYQFPLIVHGELRGNEATTFALHVRYDPSMMTYTGAQTNRNLLNGDVMTQESPPGEVDITGNGIVTLKTVMYGMNDTLCLLLFDVPHQEKNIPSQCALSVVSISQNCPATGQGDSNTFTIHGCPAELDLDIAPPYIFDSGTQFRIPVRLQRALDIQQPLSFSFTLAYDTTFLRYIGFDVKKTIISSLPVSVEENTRGELSVSALEGMPSDTNGVLLYLIFSSEKEKQSRAISMAFSQPNFAQSCFPAVRTTDALLMLNGICTPLVVKKDAFSLRQNHPNPVASSSSPTTEIEFSVLGTNRTRLDVYDFSGRRVATLIDADLDPGPHSVSFSSSRFPKGVYTYVLKEGSNAAVRKMIRLE